ncbi:GNAT family N-acetyltransferase, partial [Bacillus cereus group sp. Bce025]
MKHIENGTRAEGEYIKNKVIQYNMSILTDE